jgi:hypothetical protein
MIITFHCSKWFIGVIQIDVLNELVFHNQHINERGETIIDWQNIALSGALNRSATQCWGKYRYLEETASHGLVKVNKRLLDKHPVEQLQQQCGPLDPVQNAERPTDGWTASEVQLLRALLFVS